MPANHSRNKGHILPGRGAYTGRCPLAAITTATAAPAVNTTKLSTTPGAQPADKKIACRPESHLCVAAAQSHGCDNPTRVMAGAVLGDWLFVGSDQQLASAAFSLSEAGTPTADTCQSRWSLHITDKAPSLSRPAAAAIPDSSGPNVTAAQEPSSGAGRVLQVHLACDGLLTEALLVRVTWFLQRAKAAAGSPGVFVHSSKGCNRAPAIVLAYLVRWEGLSLADALGRVHAVHPSAMPCPGFIAQLIALEVAVRGAPSDFRALVSLPLRDWQYVWLPPLLAGERDLDRGGTAGRVDEITPYELPSPGGVGSAAGGGRRSAVGAWRTSRRRLACHGAVVHVDEVHQAPRIMVAEGLFSADEARRIREVALPLLHPSLVVTRDPESGAARSTRFAGRTSHSCRVKAAADPVLKALVQRCAFLLNVQPAQARRLPRIGLIA